MSKWDYYIDSIVVETQDWNKEIFLFLLNFSHRNECEFHYTNLALWKIVYLKIYFTGPILVESICPILVVKIIEESRFIAVLYCICY